MHSFAFIVHSLLQKNFNLRKILTFLFLCENSHTNTIINFLFFFQIVYSALFPVPLRHVGVAALGANIKRNWRVWTANPILENLGWRYRFELYTYIDLYLSLFINFNQLRVVDIPILKFQMYF